NLDEGSASWSGLQGRLDAEKIKTILSEALASEIHSADYFICGPSGLMLLIDEALNSLNISKEKIHKEYFTAPLKTEAEEKTNAVSDEPLEEADLLITLDGDRIEVKYTGQKSI